jgi:hypothetical protein
MIGGLLFLASMSSETHKGPDPSYLRNFAKRRKMKTSGNM